MRKLKCFGVLYVLLFIGISTLADTHERKVDAFNGISIRIDGTFYVEQGEKQKIEITAQPPTLEKLIAEVKDSVLIIRFNRSSGFSGTNNPAGPVSMKIVLPEIKSLTLTSSGMLYCERPIRGKSMELSVSGSGDMMIASLVSESLKASISGSGNLKVAENSKAEFVSIAITGSGFFIAEGLEAEYANVRIAGSGSCSLTANQELKARILGSGDIRYRGNPEVNSSIAGSGTVEKSD